jgi:transposase
MHDKNLKLEARIWFETHDQSAREVGAQFALSHKTIEDWARKEGWTRNKYAADKERAREIITAAAKEALQSEAGKKITAELAMTDGEMKPTEYHEEVASAIFEQIISLDAIHKKMGKAVALADQLVENPKYLSDVKTYTEVLKTAKEVIYGKDPETVIKIAQIGSITAEKMAQMSDEELLALAAKQEEVKDG